MNTEQILLLFLRTSILLLLSYLLAVGLVGGFKAWVCKKMGDDTAEHMDFLTIDPFTHVDPIGLICLLFFGFGWGRRVPVDYDAFYGRFAVLKRVVAYYSDVFMHLLLAVVSVLISGLVSYVGGACSINLSGAYVNVGVMLIRAFFSINIFLASVYIISNSIMLLLHNITASDDSAHDSMIYYIALIGPFLLFYVYGVYLQQAFQFLVLSVCKALFWFLG